MHILESPSNHYQTDYFITETIRVNRTLIMINLIINQNMSIVCLTSLTKFILD